MDFATVGFAFLAMGIAVALSSVELLTRYRSRNFSEIFLSRHYVFFAALNAAFCLVVYCALPLFSQLIVKTEFSEKIDAGLLRAVTAGLGYLVIARMSVLDITTKDGKTYGAGFDAIYNGVAQYLLSHHGRAMRDSIRKDFNNLYLSPPTATGAGERIAFGQAAQLVAIGLDPQEQVSFNDRLNLANVNFPSPQDANHCFAVYILIRDEITGAAEAASRIDSQRTKPPT